ncbi:MAG: hypothetical protein CMM10_00180 [Rhodospirillaceae bacterium]|nr:hypothetical protein [Rhodospirillaceae bacterium]
MAISPENESYQPASQESLLLDYIHRLESHMEGRRAVHVHISKLDVHNRRDHHIRIASNTFEPLVKMLEGQLFSLKNSDLFFIYKGDSQNDVETSILKLQFLFSDDPLFDEASRETHSDSDAFRTYYNVERDYTDILALVRGMVHDSQTDETEEEQVEDSRSQLVGRQQGGGEALSPRVLGRVEESLHSADLSNMVRRQFVCALIGEAAPQPLFSELYISIQDLRETLMPGVNLTKSRWLFQHLTETLDRRVLAMLSKSTDRSITGEISINLNISTLLSPEFMAFDDAVIAAMRGSIVIELQKVDIFSDLNDYMFARDFAKERGYRICIDGLTHETMPFVNRDKLGADMVKLIWQTELADEVGPKRVRRLVKSAGASKVILSRCDDEGAVKFGQDIGINMFQGRYIENLIAEESRRHEMEMARRRTQNLDFLE